MKKFIFNLSIFAALLVKSTTSCQEIPEERRLLYNQRVQHVCQHRFTAALWGNPNEFNEDNLQFAYERLLESAEIAKKTPGHPAQCLAVALLRKFETEENVPDAMKREAANHLKTIKLTDELERGAREIDRHINTLILSEKFDKADSDLETPITSGTDTDSDSDQFNSGSDRD